jgi:hypothetical protein
MDLVQTLIDSMTSIDSISAITSKTQGAAPSQIKTAITSAIPGIMESMQKNASTEEGAASLLNALGQHTNSGSMRSQLAGADLVDGDKIITKILGCDKSDFISQVAQAAGIDFNQSRTILSNIAPAIMSTVSSANNSYNEPGARSGVGADYPGGTTRSEGSAPSAFTSTSFVNNSELSQLKETVGSLLIDDEDRAALDSMKGESLVDSLKKLFL